MSTAGKVLVVLVLLVSIAWTALVSRVAVLHSNWSQQIAKLEDDLQKLEATVAQTEANVRGLKDEINRTQIDMNESLSVLRAKQAEVEKARSEMLELAARAAFQLETVEAAKSGAGADRDRRQAEREAEKAAKAAAIEELGKLRADVGRLLTQLNDLNAQFQSTLVENRALVNRLLQSRPSPRPASYRR